MNTFFKIIRFSRFKHLLDNQRNYQELSQLTQAAIRLVEDIRQGNLDSEVSIGQSTPLMKALLNLREESKSIAMQESQRRWTNEGIAKFADLLRQQSDNPEKLYDLFLKELVHYVNASQGGLFVLNADDSVDSYLEMQACYAYNRKKYIHKKIQFNEGLVGQCFAESDTILLTDIPPDYVAITSGLGAALPRCILLVPLKSNDKICGVIELASFQTFEKHQIEFIEKIGESIAATISNHRTTHLTRQLLTQAQQQAEELRSAEEEVRQNMEELASTQEELTRQFAESEAMKHEMQARENVFNYTTILSESDTYGTITLANDKLCEISKYSRQELMGQPHNIFRHPDMPKELFKLMWSTIKQGKVFRGVVKNRAKDGTHYWVDATISPVLDDNGKPIKYIGVRYVIPDDRLAEILYQESLQSLLGVSV